MGLETAGLSLGLLPCYLSVAAHELLGRSDSYVVADAVCDRGPAQSRRGSVSLTDVRAAAIGLRTKSVSSMLQVYIFSPLRGNYRPWFR